MQEEHMIEEELKQICQQIFAEQQVQQRKKQEINATILNHLSNFHKEQTTSEAVRIFKIPLIFLDKELEKLKSVFKSKTDSYNNIEKFNNIYKTYEQSIKQISLTSYCLKDFLDTDPKLPPMIECCKLKFVKYFQTVFQQYLFESVVDLLTTARIQHKDVEKITFVLKQFGKNLHQLQLTTEQEIDYYMPESSFKQHLYDHFEETYQNFYQQWYSQFDTDEYLNKVSLELEINSKIITFEDESILKQINLILYSHLLTQYKSELLSERNPKNFKNLIREYQTNPNKIQPILTLIGDLYANLNDHYEKITQNFKEIIKTEGLQIMAQKNQQIEQKQLDWNEKIFIQKLFDLYDQYLQMINKCFNIKSDFQMALNNAFESFINIPIGQNSEISDYLVICMSDLLEDPKTKKRQQTFENLVKLFVFLNHKERFIKLYKRQLAKRLLNYTRFISDNKKIQKLCQQEMDAVKEMEKKCGAQDLESLRFMIKDVQSPEIEIKIDKSGSILIQQPTIINKQQWPQFEEFQVKLLLNNEQFKNSVIEGNTQKQIIWLDCLSSVEIYWAEEQSTFNLTVPQAQILFLFNFQNEFLNLKQIQEQTQLPEQIVLNNCSIMVDFKILRKDIGQNAEICYNFNNELPKKRKKTENIKLIDADLSVIAQVEQVKHENDRDGALEASIVKIMKKEKVLQFTDLIVKVQMEQAQFAPTYNQIKIQIEKLTKNEYLERDKENMQIVRYI